MMEIKSGRGKGRGSSQWTVCYDPEIDKYSARLNFGSDMCIEVSYYEINKDIYDNVGTFEDDTNQSEELIKKGRLLYRYNDNKWGWPISKVVDANWQDICRGLFSR